MDNITLSIVIPCYNEKNNIHTIVEKVLAAPVKNKEIIVVDDKSTDGTSEILDKEIESDYGGRDEENEDPKFWGQYRGEEDGYEYISELFDFLFDPNEDYSYDKQEYAAFLTSNEEIDYESKDVLDGLNEKVWDNDEDEEEEDEEEDEWTEDIDDDEEGEWTEDIDDDDDDDINKVLAEETRLFDEHTITVTVLSVTDLHGQPRTPEDGAVYDNIQGFVGKILPIVIGEEMTIYDPESNVAPIPEEKLHTSPVMFHSEELISDNEIKHIVRTRDSIYTFTERRKNYSSTADSEDGSVVF